MSQIIASKIKSEAHPSGRVHMEGQEAAVVRAQIKYDPDLGIGQLVGEGLNVSSILDEGTGKVTVVMQYPLQEGYTVAATLHGDKSDCYVGLDPESPTFPDRFTLVVTHTPKPPLPQKTERTVYKAIHVTVFGECQG